MDHWALWQFVRNEPSPESDDEPNVHLVHLRDAPKEEIERVKAALGLAGALNGHRLVGPFIRTANRVKSVLEYIREEPSSRSMDIQIRLELGMAWMNGSSVSTLFGAGRSAR